MANPWQILGQQSSACQSDLAKALNESNSLYWETNDGGTYTKPFWTWFKQFYSTPGTVPAPPNKPVKQIVEVFPEWRFNHKFTPRERNILLCLYAKMKAEGLWQHVDGIQNLNQRAEMDIWPIGGSQRLKSILLQGGRFHHYCFSNYGGYVWGLRSVKGGTELHLRGLSNGLVNVHIDLANPASCLRDGIAHRRIDDGTATRDRNHTPQLIRQILTQQRITVPSVP